jgi:predicted amidohydrolase YtcJ
MGSAQLVFLNGIIYTVDPRRSIAQAIAIRGGRIAYVGGNTGAQAWIGPDTVVVDLERRMVLPGFHDSHVHLLSGGIELGECVLSGLATPAAVVAAIRDYAAFHPAQGWLHGNGWELPAFPEGNPPLALLDSVVPDRPALLYSADGHSAWVNSRALELAGITAETPDPERGRIERDPRTRAPSGTLRESAIDLVERLVPEVDQAGRREGLRQALRLANSFGITSAFEAYADEPMLATYSELAREEGLTVRVRAAMGTEPSLGTGHVAKLIAWRRQYAAAHFEPAAAKLFGDGVIEAETAALLEPYASRPEERGLAFYEPAALATLVTALDRSGLQAHVHAIGDRAVRSSLDAFERARAANGRLLVRHVIAHVELVHPRDIARFGELGVVAAFQPLWAVADQYVRYLTEPKLGPSRSRRLYPARSIACAGGIVAAGSDWTVSSLNPLAGIQAGVTRRDPASGPGPAWIPEEALDLDTMIAAYTINGARAMHQEAQTGSLEVGKAADLIVLSGNLFQTSSHDIHRIGVLLTLFDGRVVHRDPSWPTPQAVPDDSSAMTAVP